MIISTQTGGRLANLLYFVLLAFCISNRINIDCKYTQINSFAKQTLLHTYSDELNIAQYFVQDKKPDCLLKLNKYYQEINKDFKLEELNCFINKTILKSQYFNTRLNLSNINTTAAIHIRNGDYLNLPLHNCFNRINYLNSALDKLPKTITNIDIYSDDNQLNKKLYDSIFRTHNIIPNYIVSNDPLNDLKELSFYNTKILWNSTFSYWSAFISDYRYNNTDILTMTICPTKFTETENAITHCKKDWKLI